MLQYNVFPEGKRKILTFSYDDGHLNDIRLVELFNKYNVKATFHLNGYTYQNMTDSELEKIKNRYKGHEISCHTLHHGYIENMPWQSVVSETIEDRKILEKIAGYPVIGMSYPYGTYGEKSIQALEACGIVYSRTAKSTKEFIVPTNFMEWNPTCHHSEALELWNSRLKKDLEVLWRRPLFYIWGHSQELNTQEQWDYMENLLKEVSNNNHIWYATSIEIYNYFKALRSLQISVDEKIIYNPANITVWVEKDNEDVICIHPGETVHV